MSDYAESINTKDFKYTGKVYFHNINLETRINYPVRLVLDEYNFNFDLAQSNGFDFRLAERSNGSGVFQIWISSWDESDKHASLWFKIPHLLSNSKLTFYAFWGSDCFDNISNPEELNFLFYEEFNTTPLDATKWTGAIGGNLSDKGYLFPSASSFTTITNSLVEKNSWIIEAMVYLTEDTSCDLNDRAHGFEFIHKLFGFDVTTWNPDDRNTKINLSNGNLTVSCSYSGSRGVRAKWYRTSGKWYWEVTVYNVYAVCIGIANMLWDLVDILGRYNNYGYGYKSGATWHYDCTHDMDPFVSGDVIGVALDMDTGKIWWSRNGVWQAGSNPGIGTGARYSGISGVWYPAISLTYHYSEYAIANFGTTTFSYPTPSGFVAWVEGDSTATIESDENDFVINIMHETRVEHNAIQPGGDTYSNIDQTYGGLEFDSYQEHYISYYEPEDRVYQRLTGRKSYTDIENKIDRKVEGDTRPCNIRLYGRQTNSVKDGAYPSYISWFVVREYDSLSLVNLDGSGLYIPYENVEHQVFDYKEYTDDLTSILYPHKSSFGGNVYNLSNNLYNSETDVWISDENATSSDPIYATIYFDRTENLVSTRKFHYDSGHEKFYNASKMSDSDTDVHERDHWRVETISGWAVINFGDDRPIINVFGIKAVSDDLDACPKNYKFYGGLENYTGPFKLLCEGIFEKTAKCQSVTFINANPYKYYKFEILDTYGNNIKVQEWEMYNYIGSDKPKYISQLRLHPADFGGLEDNFPKQISLEGSNDTLNWEIVLPWINTYTPYISHDASYDKWQRYSFTNIKGYWHYRLLCKGNWGVSDGRIIIGEWEMCELSEEANIYRIIAGTTNNIKQIWASKDCGFEDTFGLIYIGNEKLNIVQRSKLVEEKEISEFYDDINIV